MTDTVPATTGLADAATAFEGLLSDDLTVDTGSPEETSAETSEKKPPENAEGDEGEGDGPEASHETTDEDAPADGGEEGSEEGAEEQGADDEGEEGSEADDKPPQTVTVTIDGKSVEVPLAEAIKGYQRHADYSRKTATLAEERRAFDEVRTKFESEDKQAVVQERGQYAHLLKALNQRLEELAPQEPDWAALYAQDKQEYLVQRDNWRAYQEQKEAAQAELARVDQLNRADFQQKLSKHIEAGKAKLLEFEPRWKDEKARAADFTALQGYAKDKLGYSDQELKQATDHRALIAVYKAMKYDEMMAKAKTIKPTGSKVPGARPGAAVRQATPATRVQTAAKKRLAASGSVQDAADIFSNMDL